ncbi:hypothetical protein MP228_010257 [Amoeboaphelidium protococcarum]|nr:hypothetical protein MP228_010257 [Amoeboaphelidium protococcarum]
MALVKYNHLIQFCLQQQCNDSAQFYAHLYYALNRDSCLKSEAQYLLARSYYVCQKYQESYEVLKQINGDLDSKSSLLLRDLCIRLQKDQELVEVTLMLQQKRVSNQSSTESQSTYDYGNAELSSLQNQIILAKQYHTQSRHQEAVQCCHNVLRECPFMVEAWMILAQCSGQQQKQMNFSRYFSEFDPSFIESHLLSTFQSSSLQSSIVKSKSMQLVNSSSRNITVRSHQVESIQVVKEKKRTRSGQTKSASQTSLNMKMDRISMESQVDTVDMAMILLICQFQYSVHSYDYPVALSLLKDLPRSVTESLPISLAFISILTEVGQYRVAYSVAQKVLALYPYNREKLETFCTVFWHLQDDSALSVLAQRLLSTVKPRGGVQSTHILDDAHASPAAFLAIGNLYSLKNNTEMAIKSFEQAIRLSNRDNNWRMISYCQSLIGYEHLAADSVNNAMNAFKSAIQADPRNYIAWYQMSNLCMKSEKIKDAEYCLRRALTINSHNVVIRTALGSLHAKTGQVDVALVEFDKAIQTSKSLSNVQLPPIFSTYCQIPDNPLPYYKKASSLSSIGRYEESLNYYKKCVRLVPQESSLYIKMAEVYKALNRVDDAAKCYLKSLSLSNPDPFELLNTSSKSQSSKECLEKLFQQQAQ